MIHIYFINLGCRWVNGGESLAQYDRDHLHCLVHTRVLSTVYEKSITNKHDVWISLVLLEHLKSVSSWLIHWTLLTFCPSFPSLCHSSLSLTWRVTSWVCSTLSQEPTWPPRLQLVSPLQHRMMIKVWGHLKIFYKYLEYLNLPGTNIQSITSLKWLKVAMPLLETRETLKRD